MGKQSRLRKARKAVKTNGGIDKEAFSILKPGEAFRMNPDDGTIRIRAKR